MIPQYSLKTANNVWIMTTRNGMTTIHLGWRRAAATAEGGGQRRRLETVELQGPVWIGIRHTNPDLRPLTHTHLCPLYDYHVWPRTARLVRPVYIFVQRSSWLINEMVSTQFQSVADNFFYFFCMIDLFCEKRPASNGILQFDIADDLPLLT